MAKETQKAKIERLEQELEQLRKVTQEQSDYINKMHASADESFSNSPYKKQLEDKIKMLEMKLKSAQDGKEHAEKLAKAKDEHLQELQEQIKQLQAKTSIQKLKNERGAGRKPKYTEQDKELMKMYKAQGKSYKEIADIYKCVPSYVFKVINGK